MLYKKIICVILIVLVIILVGGCKMGTEKKNNDMSKFAVSDSERADINALAEELKGLRCEYSTGKKTMPEDIDITIQKKQKISTIKWNGYICFEEGGDTKLLLETNSSYNLTFGTGIHFQSKITPDQTVSVKPDIYYDFNIDYTFSGQDSDTIKFVCDLPYHFTISKPMPGGEFPPVEPVMDIGMRDCMVMTGPDGNYYMTGTNGPDFWNDNDGIHIYKSTDLKEWTDLGMVWDIEKDGTWANRRDQDNRRPIWAPELHYIESQKNYFLTYSMGFNDGMCSGILKSTTGNVEGPYVDIKTDGPMFDSIDTTLFEDDDGSVYVTYGNGSIAKMKSDMSGIEGDFKKLTAADGGPIGFEGYYIVKHNGLYYVTAADSDWIVTGNSSDPYANSYDALWACSDNIYGPYSERRMLLQNAGHNNVFFDNDGNTWTTMFISNGYHVPFLTKPAIERLYFDDNGFLKVDRQKTETIDVDENNKFTLDNIPDGEFYITVKSSIKADVFVNGVKAFTAETADYNRPFMISQEAHDALIVGENEITCPKSAKAVFGIEIWKIVE
ncbi:MAG: family 43 glycosylhydrolase [Clostridiales bacterium]|jgi:hypothetical protein|nr:family 43 glycosylhydrolase [Clostridiales bacterium]